MSRHSYEQHPSSITPATVPSFPQTSFYDQENERSNNRHLDAIVSRLANDVMSQQGTAPYSSLHSGWQTQTQTQTQTDEAVSRQIGLTEHPAYIRRLALGTIDFKYHCPFCREERKSLRAIRDHINDICDGVIWYYKCRGCPDISYSSRVVEKRQTPHGSHVAMPLGIPPFFYSCSLCAALLRNFKEYKKHTCTTSKLKANDRLEALYLYPDDESASLRLRGLLHQPGVRADLRDICSNDGKPEDYWKELIWRRDEAANAGDLLQHGVQDHYFSCHAEYGLRPHERYSFLYCLYMAGKGPDMPNEATKQPVSTSNIHPIIDSDHCLQTPNFHAASKDVHLPTTTSQFPTGTEPSVLSSYSQGCTAPHPLSYTGPYSHEYQRWQ